MLRKMTKSIGRFEAGNTHDYPKGVWDKIASDLMKSNGELAKQAEGDPQAFLNLVSTEVDINTSLQSATRGPKERHQRLGSAPRIPARPRA